jgi:hypothetical protein
MKPDVYVRSYSRAIHKYRSNGFFARPLDADDKAFIESIREKGCIGNSTLSEMIRSGTYDQYSKAPAEEQDYWEQHWTNEPGIERRITSHLPPPPREKRITPHAERRRLNLIAVSAAREEMEREWQEKQVLLREERARRVLRNMLADLEWETTAALERAKRTALYAGSEPEPEPPPKRKLDYRKPEGTPQPVFAVDDCNHYVPEWRRPKRKKAKERAPRIAPLPPPQSTISEEKKRELALQAEAPLTHRMITASDVRAIEDRILDAIRGSHRQWTVDDLMHYIGCNDRQLVIHCANTLAGSGYIGRQNV